jgi:hypothetical protein
MASRPGPDSPQAAWLAFYRRNAAVYREVSEVDHDHRGHALYWAEREHAHAELLAVHPAETSPRPTSKTSVPATLERAHNAVAEVRPAAGEPAWQWLAYHRHAAAIYAEVADVDRTHHHEALAWAGVEREKVAELARQIEES